MSLLCCPAKQAEKKKKWLQARKRKDALLFLLSVNQECTGIRVLGVPKTNSFLEVFLLFSICTGSILSYQSARVAILPGFLSYQVGLATDALDETPKNFYSSRTSECGSTVMLTASRVWIGFPPSLWLAFISEYQTISTDWWVCLVGNSEFAECICPLCVWCCFFFLIL